MNTRINKVRIKRVSFAVLLLFTLQWVHGGLIICIGADGHVAFEQPDAKDCCKKNESIVSLDVALYSDFDYCVDIPVRAQKYTASTYPTFSVNTDFLIVCLDSLPLRSSDRSFLVLSGPNRPPPHNLLLATLKTVVSLV